MEVLDEIDVEKEFETAIRSGNLQAIKVYLNKGINVDRYFNLFRETPLHLAVSLRQIISMGAILKYKNISIEMKDMYGSTPLHLAVSCGYTRIVYLLLKCGADINSEDGFKRTPLHIAARCQRMYCMKMLVRQNANINCVDIFGETPLSMCAFMNLVLTDYLLDKGANPNLKTDTELLSEMALFTNNSLMVMNLSNLINKGGDVSCSDNFMFRTPLHKAVLSANLDVIQILLDAGADIDSRGRDGITPFKLAKLLRIHEVTRFLKAYQKPSFREGE